jgi:hypothetical protein
MAGGSGGALLLSHKWAGQNMVDLISCAPAGGTSRKNSELNSIVRQGRCSQGRRRYCGFAGLTLIANCRINQSAMRPSE